MISKETSRIQNSGQVRSVIWSTKARMCTVKLSAFLCLDQIWSEDGWQVRNWSSCLTEETVSRVIARFTQEKGNWHSEWLQYYLPPASLISLGFRWDCHSPITESHSGSWSTSSINPLNFWKALESSWPPSYPKRGICVYMIVCVCVCVFIIIIARSIPLEDPLTKSRLLYFKSYSGSLTWDRTWINTTHSNLRSGEAVKLLFYLLQCFNIASHCHESQGTFTPGSPEMAEESTAARTMSKTSDCDRAHSRSPNVLWL